MELLNLKIDDGELGKINVDVRFLDDGKPKPVVVFLHGFKGFKDWGFIPQVCKEFAKSGTIAVNFDFSRNGIIDPSVPKYDPEIFRTQTVSRMIDEATIVYTYILKELNDVIKGQFNGKIFAIGHSMGAAVLMMATAKYRLKFQSIALWGSIAKLDRNTENQKTSWTALGYTEIKIPETGQILPLDSKYLTDKEILGDNAIIEAIEKIDIPALIIHGKEDLIAKESESKEIKKAFGKKGILKIINSTNHTFGAKHPFENVTPALAEIIEETSHFFAL